MTILYKSRKCICPQSEILSLYTSETNHYSWSLRTCRDMHVPINMSILHSVMMRCMSFCILMNLWYGWNPSGTFVSWWYLPPIWPSVNGMQHYYHARYPTDEWHLAYMFSLVYFSVEVCLVGVFPHYMSIRRDPCIRIYAPLTLASPLLPILNSRRAETGAITLQLNTLRPGASVVWVRIASDVSSFQCLAFTWTNDEILSV